MIYLYEIINRIKEEMNFTKDVQVSDFFGISSTLLSMWKRRNSPNWEIILEKIKELDVYYIIYGIRKQSKTDTTNNEDVIINLKKQIERQDIIINALTEELSKKQEKQKYVNIS